ncbi:MAG: hypothetical protein ACOCZ6_04625 [Nanoarchaeota archaeon]
MRKTFHCIRYTLLIFVCLPLMFFVEYGTLWKFLFFVNAASVFMLAITIIVPEKNY